MDFSGCNWSDARAKRSKIRVDHYVFSSMNTLTLISLLRENKTVQLNVQWTAEELSYRTRFVFFGEDAVRKKKTNGGKKKTKIYKRILYTFALLRQRTSRHKTASSTFENNFVSSHTPDISVLPSRFQTQNYCSRSRSSPAAARLRRRSTVAVPRDLFNTESFVY